jgi:hypothetical protein
VDSSSADSGRDEDEAVDSSSDSDEDEVGDLIMVKHITSFFLVDMSMMSSELLLEKVVSYFVEIP